MGPKFTFNSAGKSTLSAVRLTPGREPKAEGSSSGSDMLTPKRPAFNSNNGQRRSIGAEPGFLKGTNASAYRSWGFQASNESLDEEDARFEAEDSAWTCTKWLASLELHHLIAAALKPPENEQFDKVKSLTREEIAKLLVAAKLEGLIDAVTAGVEKLQGQGASTGLELNTKFATEAKFEMKYGSLDLFYGGLESLIGPPQVPLVPLTPTALLDGHAPACAPPLQPSRRHGVFYGDPFAPATSSSPICPPAQPPARPPSPPLRRLSTDGERLPVDVNGDGAPQRTGRRRAARALQPRHETPGPRAALVGSMPPPLTSTWAPRSTGRQVRLHLAQRPQIVGGN